MGRFDSVAVASVLDLVEMTFLFAAAKTLIDFLGASFIDILGAVYIDDDCSVAAV